MFGQIRFLGVRFAAILANVSFEVFGLLVFGDVFQQGLLVDEALVTRVALVWLVSLMTSVA